MKLKLFLPAILGTIVEYYDYALYGFAASLLAHQFFPSSDPTVSLLKAYGVFIAGSCSKPLGSLIFGHLGDKYGRSIALKLSMFGIALPTAIVGLTPGYETLGWSAALILLICRMLQGMFVSGESDGVRIFIYESMPKTRPYLTNSISGMATMVGVYFASTAISFVSEPNFPPFAWRIPFLMGGVLGIFIILLRQYLEETPDYLDYMKKLSQRSSLSKSSHSTSQSSASKIQTQQSSQQSSQISPQEKNSSDSFLQVILKNKRGVFITAMLYGVVGGGYHFFFVFLGPYLSSSLHIFDSSQATLNTSNAILLYTLCAPLAGYLADRFGAIRFLKLSALSLLSLTVFSLYMLSQGSFPIWLWSLFAINLSFLHTPGFVVLFTQFSVGERFRCISVGHAVGSMVFSGTSPFICLQLWKVSQSALAPLAYLLFLTLLCYFALRMIESPTEKALEKSLPAPI